MTKESAFDLLQAAVCVVGGMLVFGKALGLF